MSGVCLFIHECGCYNKPIVLHISKVITLPIFVIKRWEGFVIFMGYATDEENEMENVVTNFVLAVV